MQQKKQLQVVERNYTKLPHQFLEKIPYLDITSDTLGTVLVFMQLA